MNRRVPFRTLLLITIIIAGLILAACGGGTNDGGGGTTEPTPTSQPEDGAEGTPPADGGGGTGGVEPGSSELDGPITFGDYGWDSALFHNRVAQFILENGYGYETDTIPGETIALFQGLVGGDVDVSMEIWVQQQPEFPPAVEEGKVVDLGSNFDDSVQGWFVPTYVIKGDPERGIEPMAPDLKSVEDLPNYKNLFQDPEDPSKGRFYDCIAGWECGRVNEGKFKAYGLDEHYNRFLPGSGPALASSLVGAYEKGEPWLGYYWGPTWIFGKLDLTMIEEPEYTDECWDKIFTGETACAYPSVQVNVAANAQFAEKAPDVVAFLENYQTTMDQTSEALLYMHDNEATADEAAVWFLKEREDVWTKWVSEDVAAKVKTALEQQ